MRCGASNRIHGPPRAARNIKAFTGRLAFRRRQLALANYELLFQRKFDPNQPRVPAGSSAGGQWTSGGGPESGQWTSGRRDHGGDGTFDGEQPGCQRRQRKRALVVLHRRLSRRWFARLPVRRDARWQHHSLSVRGPRCDEVDWDARHTVVTPDESIRTFENSGPAQTIYDDHAQLISKAVWTDDGPDLQTLAEPAYYGPAAPIIVQGGRLIAQKTVEAALALYTWMSARSGPGQQTVIAAKASDYKIEGGAKNPQAVWVGTLTSDEVRDICGRLKDVQDFMNKAVAKVRNDNVHRGPAEFGTKVHKLIADKIAEEDDLNFVAEYSLLKSMEAAKDAAKKPGYDTSNYGKAGTIRIDALQNRPDLSTVCIFDPKSGKKGLTAPRMLELASTAAKRFPKSHRLIVTEVRENY